MMVEMEFPRSRVEEALRNFETNSVEMAMERLFNHLKELVQEEDELSQSLSLSLGNSAISKEYANEKGIYVSYEEKPLENHLRNLPTYQNHPLRTLLNA